MSTAVFNISVVIISKSDIRTFDGFIRDERVSNYLGDKLGMEVYVVMENYLF